MTIDILPMTPRWAAELAPRIAQSDPWMRLGISAGTIEAQLTNATPDNVQCAIVSDDTAIGAMVVCRNWLAGPYLQHLSILESHRGLGAGTAALKWLITRAKHENQRSVWLCVSEFNKRAEGFYARHGFKRVAVLNDLLVAAENEILMRRRLDTVNVTADVTR